MWELHLPAVRRETASPHVRRSGGQEAVEFIISYSRKSIETEDERAIIYDTSTN